MGAFVVFFFTVFFLAIGFLLLWNGNSLQGHCCSTDDDSGDCSTKTSKTDCDGDCKWQYWNCDGPFPGQSNYNGPGKADCEDPDPGCISPTDCPTDCLTDCICPTDCPKDCPSDCSYTKDTECNLTAAEFCNRASYSESLCKNLTKIDKNIKKDFSKNVTVDCTNTTASFPGCKWVKKDTNTDEDKCILNSS